MDFLKIIVELLGRSDERGFTTDPDAVTAVIASRNGAESLERTLMDLILLLSPQSILVVDDGSSDATAAVAMKFGCEVHRFERSRGKAAAIHYALRHVHTPFVLLLVAIASLPLVAGRWWHANGNKGIVVAALSLPTAGYLLYLGDEEERIGRFAGAERIGAAADAALLGEVGQDLQAHVGEIAEEQDAPHGGELVHHRCSRASFT